MENNLAKKKTNKRAVMSSFSDEEEDQNNEACCETDKELQELLEEFEAANNPKYKKVVKAKKSTIHKDKKPPTIDMVESLIHKKMEQMKMEDNMKILREKVERLGKFVINKREEIDKRMDAKILDTRPIHKILSYLTEHYEFIIQSLPKMTNDEEVFLVGYDFRKNYLELSKFLSNN